MRYDPPLIEAVLLRRRKRFLADVRLPDGTEVVAHCPNPGSMLGVLPHRGAPPDGSTLDRPCRLQPANHPKRKLKWTLEQVVVDGIWCLVNTARPNALVVEALRAGRLPELEPFEALRTEVRYGEASRIDVLLEGAGRTWVEVKNVSLVQRGVGRFPDSVSARAARHLDELAERARAGDRAVLLYTVSRGGARRVEPAAEVDPRYAEAYGEARRAGVEALAAPLVIGATEVGLGPDRLPTA